MPLIMERERFFVGLMGLGVNNTLEYPNYFAMMPTGPDPNAALTEGFFELAGAQTPRPSTVALVSADAEFSRNPILGAKANAEKHNFRIVHESTYPLTTDDFTPIIDAVAESGCDLLFLCSCKNGEWAQPRVLQMQFRGIAGHEANQFKDGSRQVVVSPSMAASGELIFPYADAL